MIRLLPALILLASLLVVPSASRAALDSATVLSGGNLPNPVTLAPADEDAFFRRINRPPRLDQTPVSGGVHYTVTSPYWDRVVRDKHSDKEPADAAAAYFPDGGFVRVSQADDLIWYVLDLRQQEILNRYIGLDRQGAIADHPGLLEVLTAASMQQPITIQIGARQLSDSESASFWGVAKGLKPGSSPSGEAKPPLGGSTSVWLIFGLPEGRSSQMLYRPDSSTLVDSTGIETYRVPAGWLVPVLGPAAPQADGSNRLTGHVRQEKGTGSPIWWLIMFGAGAFCIATGVRLYRHPELLRRLPFLGD